MKTFHLARETVLSKKWDNVLHKLIQQTQSKGKRMQAYARKLRGLTGSLREKQVSFYMKEAKNKYLVAIRKWLASRIVQQAVISQH
jgi:hypothetical protein